MTPEPSMEATEQRLQAEVERLRTQFTDTQDLYREVAVLMFFRFGVTPTANKLYGLVKRGSMTAPARALSSFWAELREKSRVRIEHPDLPQDLRAAAGEITAALWRQAQAQANESLEGYRREVQAQATEARAAAEAAQTRVEALSRDVEALKQVREELLARVGDLEGQLSAARTERAALGGELNAARQELMRVHRTLEATRAGLAAELEQGREALRLAETRHLANEERAAREIDRERTACAKLQKELERTRAAVTEAAEDHRNELAVRHAELADLRQRLGVIEGSFAEAKGLNAELFGRLNTAGEQLATARAELSVTLTEANGLRARIEELQHSTAETVPGGTTKPTSAMGQGRRAPKRRRGRAKRGA